MEADGKLRGLKERAKVEVANKRLGCNLIIVQKAISNCACVRG